MIEEFSEIPVSSKLDTILLSFNRLKYLNAERILNAPNLSVLDLKNNKMVELDLNICKLQNLKTLDLSNNDLHDLPNEVGFL